MSAEAERVVDRVIDAAVSGLIVVGDNVAAINTDSARSGSSAASGAVQIGSGSQLPT
ncbi:hypothetical protein ACL02S_15145 [Nocardia sp. 004]|uniref:hypothetical protein n=1 Tax=Nocardia sp. 004 TaxID=3385978 RepID=UPI0039A27D38